MAYGVMQGRDSQNRASCSNVPPKRGSAIMGQDKKRAQNPEGRKLDVCVVLLDDGYASTSLMPIEVFHSAGALWRELKGESPEPRFRVTTASIDGRPARSPYGGMTISPETSIAAVTKSDIVIVPTS